jgi:protein tyrosine/serine phosphatase
LRICSDPRNHPVLFHCSSGKDRTGLIAALILAVCGLSDEEIFDDYEKSQTYLAPCMHLIQIEGAPPRTHSSPPLFD